MTIETKAAAILRKLYLMRKRDFNNITVEDILVNASPEEINYYYYWLCEVTIHV